MKLSSAEQESLIQLLTRIYTDIREIEEEYQLFAGGDDFRPRIEYFHDAVRAFSSGDEAATQKGGRLSVELLAYDVSCLRYIQSMPLSPFKPHGETLSPHTGLVKTGPGLAVKNKRPDRATKERISELYQNYAVLFSALLKPMADRDYKDRIDALNQDVQELHSVIQQLQALSGKKNSLSALVASIQNLEEDQLRALLTAFVQQQKYNKKEDIKKLTQFLGAYAGQKDRDIAAIEAAHMNYALGQLGIYESSKDLLKKMAGQGMNLVGKFVEASVAQSRREMGR